MQDDKERNDVYSFEINEAFASNIVCSCSELDISAKNKVNNNYGAMS